jgi:hypothetical protein
MNNNEELSPFPVTGDITLSRILTYVVATLLGLLSVAGLVFPENIYKSGLLVETYMTNDVINLVVGIPILIGSVWFTNRNNLAGLLCWPGALLFVVYNYIAYIFGMPFSLISLAYMVLIVLSAFIIYDLLIKIDGQAVKNRLSGSVGEKLSGWFLLIFGILFILRAGNEFLGAYLSQKILAPPDISVLISDISISVLWIAGGILLLRKTTLGYTSALGLLFAASMLFVGLVIFLLVQPLITTAQFSVIDLIVVAIMGILFSIPFAVYFRGALKAS